MAITELKSVYSLEQITRLWNNQEAEQLNQQQQGAPAAPATAPAPAAGGPPHGSAAGASHRGPQGPPTLRRKPKEIPATTIDQKAAAGRAATGWAREECLRAARASGEVDSVSDSEEDAAIKLRLEEEMAQQALP